MASQRLVFWNWTDFKPDKTGYINAWNLDYDSLIGEWPEMAQVIGHGRIISHHAMPHERGVLLTFIVDY
ncbi:hypothetical protein GCM10023084_54250 [Streptomyces lacrimifluminis]|uniref:Uncharacterized protein n=1 Tax=Streptomyces lacrimifluminis TaxID=1500077 RepID=A0A917NX90_9ACTN|nr:hypothetical protein [Streptomyces lacrimifluminis]GGJ34174.1 hypothetical protein GCM10012282_33610 [Streptomyces lacrimifluminis]